MRPLDNAARPLRWIVSGGIGSGKSTVLAILADLGATVIEADRIGHDVLEPGGPAFAAVAARWPQVVIAGRIDRRRLAGIVFSDGEQLAELESITHPFIAAEIARRVTVARDRDVVLELPLLSDLAGPDWTRVVVDAPEEVRLDRSVSRGHEAADVVKRMTAQPNRERWVEAADFVIDNSGTIDDLRDVVERLWRRSKETP